MAARGKFGNKEITVKRLFAFVCSPGRWLSPLAKHLSGGRIGDSTILRLNRVYYSGQSMNKNVKIYFGQTLLINSSDLLVFYGWLYLHLIMQ